MNRKLNFGLVLLLGLLLFGFAGCSDDDDNKDPVVPVVEDDPWVGNWLSAGANVAYFVTLDPVNADTVDVTMNADNTIVLRQHSFKTGDWTTSNGTYTVTESASGDVHTIGFTYPDLEQIGIFQIVAADPDTLKLEVVPTTFTPQPTVENGLGFDYGDLNIQIYLKQ